MLASRTAGLTIATARGDSVWITDGFRDSFCPSSDTWAVSKCEGFKDDIRLTNSGDFHGLSGVGQTPSARSWCAASSMFDGSRARARHAVPRRARRPWPSYRRIRSDRSEDTTQVGSPRWRTTTTPPKETDC